MVLTEKWAFCHIPKNGGTNFVMRSPYKPDKNLNKISRHNLPNTFKNIDVPWIGIVRNPYSRYLSWYFFAKKIHSWDFSFQDFVKLNIFQQPETSGDRHIAEMGGSWHRWWPQHYWTDQGVKTFKLETDLAEMEDFVGFKFSDTKHNATVHEEWHKYYTQELKNIVYNRFK